MEKNQMKRKNREMIIVRIIKILGKNRKDF